jgi:Fur family transcriptional regulator, peroxide stress response regulator
MDKIGVYLIKHEIKPSLQRLKIYEFLYNNKNHPTVDNIYMALSPEMPTLSKTTVYNTLKLFISKGIVRCIHIEDNEVRYDADTIPHGHFKCIGCGGLFDFPFDHQLQLQTNLKGFKITEEHFYLKGYCKLCGAN